MGNWAPTVGVYKIIKFIPNTNTVNTDRSYFIDENTFIKVDENISRGLAEAKMLSSLEHPSIQKYLSSELGETGSTHILKTQYFVGETLENLSLTDADILRIESQLFDLMSYMISIHISNILYNGEKILLIDWETSCPGDALEDLFGPPTPTNHCGIINVINYMRQKRSEKNNKNR